MRRWTQAFMCLMVAACGLSCSSASDADTDPRADAALRRMSETLAKASSFKLHSTATIEQRTESGQLAQFSRDAVVSFVRPDKLSVDVRRGADRYMLWHEGKELTIVDVRRNVYAVVATPQRVDEMLDFMAENHGLVIPLDDLLYPNPYEELMERVKSASYVDQQDIGGRTCDHLLCTQDNVDWQIWIDAGTPAVPRKVVITYKDDPDRPQFEAVLDDWQFDLPADPSRFTPQTPQSARRVEIGELMQPE